MKPVTTDRLSSLSGSVGALLLSIALTSPVQAQTRNAQAEAAARSAATERANKQAVGRAFAAWAAGGTRFFDILSDDVDWTILGAGPSAGTHRGKTAFLDRAVAPFAARLSVPLKPTVRAMYADGDQVITLFDGAATTRDGRPYRNTYAWFFRMRNGRAVEVRALLDLTAYDAVLATVTPAPSR